MHPLNHKNFGITGMAVSFYNGTEVTTGYIVKQLSQNRFTVSDGTITKIGLYLAPTTSIATSLTSYPQYFTIPINPYSSASGANFVPYYAPKTMSIQSPGIGYLIGDVIQINGTNGTRITVTSTDSFGYGEVTGFNITTPGTGVTSFPTNPQDFNFINGGATFHGTISGNTLTVTTMNSGTIVRNQVLSGSGITYFPTIESFISGSGGVGTYSISNNYTISSPIAMTSNGIAGLMNINSWFLSSVTADGSGTGYTVGDELIFNGIGNVAAHVSAVVNGGPTSVIVDNTGSLTNVANSVSVTGPIEYVCQINKNRLSTTKGNMYYWSLGESKNKTAYIPQYIYE